MAKSQMETSKNPTTGASTFMPREMKMMRSVERVTTHNSAKKTKIGNQRKLGSQDATNEAIGNTLLEKPVRRTGATGPESYGSRADAARASGFSGVSVCLSSRVPNRPLSSIISKHCRVAL